MSAILFVRFRTMKPKARRIAARLHGVLLPNGLEALLIWTSWRWFKLDFTILQSPDMPDLLLHETAVAIFRKRMRTEKPLVVPWKETEAQWTERARRVIDWRNASCKLKAQCREFPKRLAEVQQAEGDKLKK